MNYLKQKVCKTSGMFLNDWENYEHIRNNYNKLFKNTIKRNARSEQAKDEVITFC